jgi:hypothetical protein
MHTSERNSFGRGCPIPFGIIKGECLPLNDPPAQRDVGSLAQEQKQIKKKERLSACPPTKSRRAQVIVSVPPPHQVATQRVRWAT